MPSNKIRATLSPTHHALLFAWIGREVAQRVGEEQGEAIMRKAARRYGEQRGHRMALRAQANGHALTMTHFLAYGEWQAEPGTAASETVERVPHFKYRVTLCPWHNAWQENDLMPFGRFYCMEIDLALVHGFNPDLRLDVNDTLSNEGTYCEFVFYDADLTAAGALTTEDGTPVAEWEARIMPWDYHLGHLFKTAGEVVIEVLGQAGQEAMDAAITGFARRFGDEAAQIVQSYAHVDFDRLPESR